MTAQPASRGVERRRNRRIKKKKEEEEQNRRRRRRRRSELTENENGKVGPDLAKIQP